MKVVIVEDEIIAGQTLCRLIGEVRSDVEILTVIQTVEESIEWFETNPTPDLVFMDIHLADGSSFDIFKKTEIKCPIIFTTAYNEYALEAFEVNSIDYLLKPISRKRLIQALDKFANFGFEKDNMKLITEVMSVINQKQNHHKTHFLIPYQDKLIPLHANDMAYCTSEFKIVRVHTFDSRTFTMDYSLDELMKNLDPEQFFRVNRQYIVAHKSIKDISLWFTGKLSVNLCVSVPERILVSKARVADFKSWYTRR